MNFQARRIQSLAGSLADRLAGKSLAACRAAAYLAAALVAGPFFFHLARGSKAYLVPLEDDYYYYAIIADRLVASGKLTFDGTTLTNGFHPLWFLVVTTIRAMCGRFGTSFYAGFAFVLLGCMVATYELSVRLVRALGAEPPLAAAIGVTFALGNDELIASGMEAAIAVPLFLLLLAEAARTEPMTPRRAAGLGFIASLAILARLDLGLAVAMLIIAWLVLAKPAGRTALCTLTAFGAAGGLVPLYAVANLFFFGALLPISALAKQQLRYWALNRAYLRFALFHTQYGHAAGFTLVVGAAALLLTLWRGPRGKAEALAVGGVALSFACLFFFCNSLTGWTFFGWYSFPFAAALPAALFFACSRFAHLIPSSSLRVAAAALAVLSPPVLAARYFVQHGPLGSIADNSILNMSYQLADKVRERDGLYSMGAIGGVVTYAVGSHYLWTPVSQNLSTPRSHARSAVTMCPTRCLAVQS